MRALLWISLIAFFLNSCATITPTPTSNKQIPWENREKTLSRLDNWRINGKIGVQTAQDSGSATINWTQTQQHYIISLLGPLGSNELTLNGGPGGVTMVSANGKQSSAASPEQLLAQQWGWHIPVSNLRYWIRGLPVPGIPASTHFDNYHRLSDLDQQGSHIQFLSYTTANGMELPQKIYITSPSIKTKIVIYEWNTHIYH